MATIALLIIKSRLTKPAAEFINHATVCFGTDEEAENVQPRNQFTPLDHFILEKCSTQESNLVL
jgi:hypothetical protein